jgi:hypothetical protein
MFRCVQRMNDSDQDRSYPCRIYELLISDMAIREVRTTQQHGIKRGSLRSMIRYWKMVSLCGLTQHTLFVFIFDSVHSILTTLVSLKLGSFLRTRSPKGTYLGMKSSTTTYPWFASAQSMQLAFSKDAGTHLSIFACGLRTNDHTNLPLIG